MQLQWAREVHLLLRIYIIAERIVTTGYSRHSVSSIVNIFDIKSW